MYVGLEESGFGVFYDRQLTKECVSMTCIRKLGVDPKIKKLKLYFGSPYDNKRLYSKHYRGIFLTVNGDDIYLGKYLQGGVSNAFCFEANFPENGSLEISISSVIWYV